MDFPSGNLLFLDDFSINSVNFEESEKTAYTQCKMSI